jgi:integrase
MTGKQELVNWEEPVLQRWLGTITRKTTLYNYKSSFRVYTQFTGMAAGEMIDEALEDLKRDPREKRDIVLRRLIDFYHWLKTEYPRRSRGQGKHAIVGKGVSDKLAHARVAAIRSFYGTFGVTVRMKGRHKLPRPRVKNKRMIVNAEQVKVLLDHARTPRDRAIMLSHFQGGMDVSTVCSINYGDIKKGLDRNEHPLKVDLYRPKTGVEYYTFLGKDAVNAIKAYLSDMESRGVTFTYETPLFLKERGKSDRITTNLIQNMMKTVAKNSGFIDGKNNGKAFNPLGPHALRESFGSIMINSGIPDSIVDFWLGHEVGEMGEAYKSVQFEALKKMYLEREKLLSVSGPKVDVEEIEEKVRFEVEQRNRQLQLLVNGLTTENLEMKSKVAKVELEHIETKKELQQLSLTVKSLVKKLEELTET